MNNGFPDQEVLALVAQGDERAFRHVIRKYSPVIYPYLLYWLKDPQVAEEVSQDVFLRVWQNRQKLPEVHNFSGYIYTIARNRAYSELKRQITAAGAGQAGGGHDVISSNQPSLEAKELAGLIAQAINTLPPRRKEIFLLSRNEELTYEQIAERLQISRSTVREHMVAALVTLRQYLQQHGDILFFLLLFFHA